MKALKRCAFVLKRTGAIHIFWAYLLILVVSAVVLWRIEPGVETIGDGLWYCFIASTTVGFGDIYAVTMIGRIVTVFVTVCGILTVAMVPGVVLAYYLEFIKAAERETASVFLEKLETLPELSKEELKEISERVKEVKKKIK